MEAFWELRTGCWFRKSGSRAVLPHPVHPQRPHGPITLRLRGFLQSDPDPMVTGTSLLGVIAADMLGSYGSLSGFHNISHITQTNTSTMGASGDRTVVWYLNQVLSQMVIDEKLLGDGHSYSPRGIHSWLTRAIYSHRSKRNSLWNTLDTGGYAYGESFLGCVNMLAVAYEAPSLAAGYGAYLAQPLLGEVLEEQPLSRTRLVERKCCTTKVPIHITGFKSSL